MSQFRPESINFADNQNKIKVMQQILRQIRTDLRRSMNGVIAASMREKGLDYRMNFGVDIRRIKQISLKYAQDKTLAEILWKEDVREMKILATMLYPSGELLMETANRWVRGISQQEIREQVCKNLFQEVPYAGELVNDWIKNEDERIRTTGYWLFARLCIIHSVAVEGVEENGLLKGAVNDLQHESMLLRQAALNALKYDGRLSPGNAARVLDSVASFVNSDNLSEKEMLDQLRFEFGVDG